MKIYTAIVQYPMADLTETDVRTFTDRKTAENYVTAMINDEDHRNGYTIEEMNHGIFEQEI